ncbi:MAG TPA: hypothetical protein VJT15_00530 [Pyrinomonadaceae bacterium]|nr:hypothetical protein [Pyrinomonadaceae bacterium]
MKKKPPLAPPTIQRSTPGKQNAPVAPNVYRPQPVPKVLQRKTNAVQQNAPKAAPPGRTTKPNQSAVQMKSSRVVQAVKYYPNLHPGAIEPVNASNVFRLNSFADQYRLHQVNNHGVNVPNQQYNFVRTREGEMLLHNRYRHPSIAEGKQVLYAGEISFNNGKLSWWSNGSGHYQPSADDAQQANLPMDQFYSYQQIIKGEHTRKKNKS